MDAPKEKCQNQTEKRTRPQPGPQLQTSLNFRPPERRYKEDECCKLTVVRLPQSRCQCSGKASPSLGTSHPGTNNFISMVMMIMINVFIVVVTLVLLHSDCFDYDGNCDYYSDSYCSYEQPYVHDYCEYCVGRHGHPWTSTSLYQGPGLGDSET